MKLVLLFILILPVCFLVPASARQKEKLSTAQSQKENPVHGFWKWFKENQTRLRKFETDPNLYLNELLTQAKKIKPGLAIELEPPQHGIINMTISADGDRNLFATVKRIIAQAPQIEGWKFFAFRQRMSAAKLQTMKVKMEDIEIDPSAMKFFPVVSDDSLDVIVYCNGVTETNYTQVAYQCLLLMDNILGEYDGVTKVRNYDFHNMPVQKQQLAELYPLLGLPAYVDNFYEKRKAKVKK